MHKGYYAFLFLVLLLTAYSVFTPAVGARWSSLSDTERASSSEAHPLVRASRAVASSLMWISPAVPQGLRQTAERWSISTVDTPAAAALRLEMVSGVSKGSTWVYALVTPFPTVVDGVTFNELQNSWKGNPAGPFAGRPLLMDHATLATFSALWGAPADGVVQTVLADQLLDTAWSQRPAWAIVPFEELDPRWKVLSIDGDSPIEKGFEISRYQLMQTSFDYPLVAHFALDCARPCPLAVLPTLPETNRDPSKMTTLITSGVTALVRATAFTMEAKGVTYPGRDIQDWMTQADITHVSNEVPFAVNCPPPNPSQTKRLVFCSDPRYIDLLKYIGADVIELTGNHYADYGPQAMLLTLQMYRDNHMAYYGGGADLEDARKPLLLENHGNKIAFIGCNSVDIGRMPTATTDRPGAAPCDYDYMTAQIRQLHNQGYLVITSFQYYETYASKPFPEQVHDFRLMAEAGATIVQGSQAHTPEAMEFYEGAFVHYGLGNLFFDQMGDSGVPTRQEFLDRHVFYDGRYISTELLTAKLEDFARPRPMTPEERASFLAEYFAASGW